MHPTPILHIPPHPTQPHSVRAAIVCCTRSPCPTRASPAPADVLGRLEAGLYMRLDDVYSDVQSVADQALAIHLSTATAAAKQLQGGGGSGNGGAAQPLPQQQQGLADGAAAAAGAGAGPAALQDLGAEGAPGAGTPAVAAGGGGTAAASGAGLKGVEGKGRRRAACARGGDGGGARQRLPNGGNFMIL